MSKLWGWDPSDSKKDEILNAFSASAFTDKYCTYPSWVLKPCEALHEIEIDSATTLTDWTLWVRMLRVPRVLWELDCVVTRSLSTMLKRLWHLQEAPDVWNQTDTTHPMLTQGQEWRSEEQQSSQPNLGFQESSGRKISWKLYPNTWRTRRWLGNASMDWFIKGSSCLTNPKRHNSLCAVLCRHSCTTLWWGLEQLKPFQVNGQHSRVQCL